MFGTKKPEVPCFGSCGALLVCKCDRVYQLCAVHGRYGSLCTSCLSYLVASTI